MKKNRKAKQKGLEALTQLLMIICAGIGWMLTHSLKGVFLSVSVGVGLLLVYLIWSKSKSLERIRKSGINEIDTMDGVQFENYLQILFKSRGYRVDLTPSTGDYGADLVMKKDGNTIVVQVKRYSKAVGIKAVQEIIPAMKIYNAQHAWVVSNNNFTKAAIKLAETHEVRLIGRSELISYINELAPSNNPNPVQIKKEIKQEIRGKCEECQSPLIIRKSKKGIFYGCSSFPKCTYTKNAT